MVPVTILIPQLSTVGDVDRKIVELFGGYSLPSSPTVYGAWLDGNSTLHHDESRPYTIALDLIKDGPKLQVLIEYIKLRLKQQAVYLEYLGHVEII